MIRRRKTPVQIATTEPHLCSMNLRFKILHGVPFFADLTHEQLVEVNQLFHEKGFDKGDYIFFAGDPAEFLYIIAEGRVKLLRHTSTGKDVMLDLLIPGEFFGTLSTESSSLYQDTVQAVTPICALAVSREDFRSVITRYPTVGIKVLDTLAVRLEMAHATIQQLSAQSAEKRIATTLLRLAAKLGEKHDVGLLIQTPLTRDELAEMTATTPETASRVISQFQKEGWIATGRQWVALTDSEALNQIAQLEG